MEQYFMSIEKDNRQANEVQKVIHICLCMIFITHAAIKVSSTILEKKLLKQNQEMPSSQQEFLTIILKMSLPKFALKQMGQILIFIADRINSLPSPWLESMTVLLSWLLIHRDDSILSEVFSLYPQLPKDLSRIHKMLSMFCMKELKSYKDEEEQTKILSMMGNTLLPEELYFVGFVPLQSYIDKKKTIQQGNRCPQDKEVLIRSMILRDCLEEMKCTFEDLKEREVSVETVMKEESKEQITNDIFAMIDD